MNTSVKPQGANQRLGSWKEVAAFFESDESTVRRWEKDRGLPIHRVPGGAGGKVFAYTDELSAWLAAPPITEPAPPRPDVPRQSDTRVESPRRRPVNGHRLAGGASSDTSSVVRRWKIARLLVAATIALGVLSLALFYRYPGAARFRPRPASRHDPTTGSVLASTTAHNPDAEQFYLKGRYYWNKRTPDGLSKSVDYFTQAIVHDPNYAQAYVGLADSYNLMREYTLMPPSEAYPRALAAAKKAVELDDQSSEAHAALAFASFFGMWDVATGLREFRRAIDLNPKDPIPHHWYASALMALHRWPEALVEMDRAQALDPTSNAILADKCNSLLISGRNDEAVNLLKQMELREPDFRSVHIYLAGFYFRIGDYLNYIAELQKDALLVHDESALAIANAAEKGFAAAGPQGMFKAMLRVQRKLYAQHLVPPTDVAKSFAMLGNKTEALRYLNIAYEERDNSLLFVQVDKEFDTLQDDPAYRDLLARMNLKVSSTN